MRAAVNPEGLGEGNGRKMLRLRRSDFEDGLDAFH